AGGLIVWVAFTVQPVDAIACLLFRQLQNRAGAFIRISSAVAHAVLEGDFAGGSFIRPLLRGGLGSVVLGVASFFQVLRGLITQGFRSTSKGRQINSILMSRVLYILRQAGNELRCSNINLGLRLGRSLFSWVFLCVSSGGATKGQSASE